MVAKEAAARPDLRFATGPASRPGRWVGLIAVLSALVAVGLAAGVFPHLSIDNDEAIYRLQAETLAQGHLFPAAPRPAGSFTPWLAAVVGDHYVLKYPPVVTALPAVSIRLTGSWLPALAVVAAAAVVATYHLGVAALGDRKAATVGTALFASSPLVLVQSALLLPYLPTLVLLELAALGLLRGYRAGRAGPMLAAGLAGGLALWSRPYDALLFFGPLLGWALWRAGSGGARACGLGWLAVGAAPAVAGMLTYNRASTGSARRPPFALSEPRDAIGFGLRAMYPTDAGRLFTPLRGLSGMAEHVGLLALGWVAGGVLLFGLAVRAVTRRQVRGPVLALVAGAVALAVGYVGVWGTWNAAVLWGGVRYVGPFYLLPVLVPLALVGGRALPELVRRRRRLAVRVGVAGALLSSLVLAVALIADARYTRHDASVSRAVESLGGRPLVFFAGAAPYLQHPAAVVSNHPSRWGGPLFAVATGSGDFAVLAAHPDQPAYLLQLPGSWNLGWTARNSGRLEQLGLLSAPEVRLALTVAAPAPAGPQRLLISTQGRTLSYPVPVGGMSSVLRLQPGTVDVDGLGPAEASPAASPPGVVEVAVENAAGRRLDTQLVPVRSSGGAVDVLAPIREVGTVGEGSPLPLRLQPF